MESRPFLMFTAIAIPPARFDSAYHSPANIAIFGCIILPAMAKT
jgi:hypothetical protein